MHASRYSLLSDEINVKSRLLKVFGIPEAEVARALQGASERLQNVSICIYSVCGEGRVRIEAWDEEDGLLEQRLDQLEGRIRKRLGDMVYGKGEESLEGIVGALLRARGLSVAVAESCTGGLISHRLTNIPGSSDYMRCGLVVYSLRSKKALLDIPEETLDRFGAISEQIARAMAVGVRRKVGTDIGLSTTGVAGPTGGTSETPVGTVVVGLSHEGGDWAGTFHFSGDRRQIKMLASSMALDRLRRHLLGIDGLKRS